MQIPRILVVDSKVAELDLYQEFLKFPEFETQMVNSVADAVQMITAEAPDLIVADIPDLDDGTKIARIAEQMQISLVYASYFKDYEFEDVPKFARIVNKPFRGVDLRFTVRAEIARRERKAAGKDQGAPRVTS